MAQNASEKTEKATAKKRRDARRDGQVLKSAEVNTAFCAIVMFAFLSMSWVGLVDKLIAVFKTYLGTGVLQLGSHEQLTFSALEGLYLDVLFTLFSILLPILGIAMLVGIVANLFQVGFLFTTKPLQPKLSRINPISGFKRLLSMKSLVDLLKSIMKVILLGWVFYSEYKKRLPTFGNYMGLELYDAIIEIMKSAFAIALRMALVFSIIAFADYLFQWRKHEKDLMMTKQEVKDEYKNTEGDPQIKSRIRQKQRQMSMMRMMDAVPSADVVITNPTHFAVALRYKQGLDDAPVVIAKGQDFMARRIKEVARENGIEIVENKPLAQSLYKLCELDQQIPVELYQAVADILVYVMRRKNSYAGR